MSTHLPGGSRSHVVDAAGTRIHCVEAGDGPLVLLVHGFPESWYSWRHQLPALADAGYRAVAIDVRGYGRSSKPLDVDAYRMVRLVADNVGVVRALGAETATIVGHDWGAPIAWTSALLRPDVFTAVAGLSVPYSPPSPFRPLEMMRVMAGDEEFYVEYFQEPGRAEAEIEADVRDWLLGFMFSASGDADPPDPNAGTIATMPHGAQMKARFQRPDSMPPWLSDDDLDVYAAEFEHTGLRGPLNRYRNVDRDWEDLAAWREASIDVPSLFIGGDRDGPTVWGAPAIAAFGTTLPGLYRSIVLEGCGHWTQQERPDEVNDALLAFLGALS
ncbi:MAG: alpha/beta hydrolase [Ilumatobacter fluminis]|uniref:alpha/beta fold hydrolase n=1 Tax=Ilumatobacter fluminis TaxID=467091 RepID=UPI0032ECF3AE